MQTTVLVVLALLTAIGEAGLSQTASVRMTSLPVSPTVVATIATRGGELVLLALWRGGPRWHSGSGARSVRGGGDQTGKITTTLVFGDTHLDLAFDASAHTAVVQGRTATVPPGTNVLLVDSVDGPGGGKLTKALSIDPAGVDVDPRLGLEGLVPVLSRSQEIVAFLQCDAVPDNPRSVEPCQSFKKR
jgi:hypothetical protein